MKLTLIRTLLGLSMSLFAASAHAETWVGSGELFGPQGKKLGDYRLEVVSTKLAPDTVQTAVTVTLPGGAQKKYFSESVHGADGWSTTGDHGTGGGHCFGALQDLCQSYTVDADGTAYATTIVFDSPIEMRLLRTELENGVATRFFRENLKLK